MSPTVAILAGGYATRLRPITERIPKSLVDVAGRPFAEHQLELLKRNGLTDVVFLLGHLGQAVQASLGDGSRWGLRLRYAFDGPQPLGTGGAIRSALPELGDPFFVLNGDSYLECDYQAAARAFAASGTSGLMTVFRNEDQWDRSNVLFSEGRILRYDKRDRTPEMRHIDYGLAMFRRAAFAGRARGEPFDLVEVFQELLVRDDLAGFEVTSRFYEIGSFVGLEEARQYLSGESRVQ